MSATPLHAPTPDRLAALDQELARRGVTRVDGIVGGTFSYEPHPSTPPVLAVADAILLYARRFLCEPSAYRFDPAGRIEFAVEVRRDGR